MPHIDKNPAVVPVNVTAQVNDQNVSVKGLKGELSVSISASITAELKDNEIVANRPDDHRRSCSPYGLSRSLTNNMVVGATEGYTTKMEIFGVGYRVAKRGKGLEFSLGYLHLVLIEIPEGTIFDVDGTTKLSIVDTDKQQVGQLVANIRRLRKDDPYKGKDIRYDGEQIRRKIGKTGK